MQFSILSFFGKNQIPNLGLILKTANFDKADLPFHPIADKFDAYQ